MSDAPNYLTLWLNYFLAFLDAVILGLIARFALPLAGQWKEPHANFAMALLVWMSGIILLRIASLIRITNDLSCFAHNCLGGGSIGHWFYNIGGTIDVIGLVLVLRSVGVSQGTYTWLKLVVLALIMATVGVLTNAYVLSPGR